MTVVTKSPNHFEELIKNVYVKYAKLIRYIGYQPQ